MKIVRAVGMSVLILFSAAGIIGGIPFIVLSQDLHSDKKILFSGSAKRYESRRYTFGFTTLDGIRYRFETYRSYGLAPFEKRMDTTDFFDNTTDLNLSEEGFKIEIQELEGKRAVGF